MEEILFGVGTNGQIIKWVKQVLVQSTDQFKYIFVKSLHKCQQAFCQQRIWKVFGKKKKEERKTP